MSMAVLGPIGVLAALAPAAVLAARGVRAGTVFWLLTLAAVAAPTAWAVAMMGDGWRTGFAEAIWITVSATLIVYCGMAVTAEPVRRLSVLLMPYLALLGAVAAVWAFRASAPGEALVSPVPDAWLALHIALALGTYASLTLAAIAGLSVFLQDRALKNRRPTALTRMLPSLADGEALEFRLLFGAEALLGLGLATGMAAQYFLTGAVLALDHKTILTGVAFAIIGGLLIARQAWGTRGRGAARAVLIAYLIFTLGYLGVKLIGEAFL